MGYVTLIIEGLSASYYKNGKWNVVFPCDSEHHLVKFYTSTRGKVTGDPISLRKKNITITTEGGKTPESPYGRSFHKVIDLTSDNLHKEGVTFKELSGNTKKSMMTVENAVFYAAELKSRFNYIFDTRKILCEEYGSIVGGEIQLEKDGKVILKFSDIEKPSDTEKTLEFEDGYFLHFDNVCSDCTPQQHSSDFELYEDIFENVENASASFKLMSYPLPLREIVEIDDAPIIGQPPAFCDGLRISKFVEPEQQ